jgi:hypothetical protein
VSKKNELQALREGHFITSSTDLAASLMACGCKPLESGACTNTYTDSKPFKTGRPGEVRYHLENNSSTFHDGNGFIKTEELAKAYSSPDPNEILKIEPWILMKRNNKTFLLPRTAKKTAKDWGLND